MNGARSLSQAMSVDDRFTPCVLEQLTTYALGRGLKNADHDTLEALHEAWAQAGYRLPALVTLIATSAPFRFRAGEPEKAE